MQLTQELLEDSWREYICHEADASEGVPVELAVAAAVNNAQQDAVLDRFYPPKPSDVAAYNAYIQAWQETQELIDLVDAREDEEFFRQGAW